MFKIRDSRLLWALVIGCLLRLIPLMLWPSLECVRDECTYLNLSKRMEAGLGMTSSAGWLWAPGYPFLLASHSKIFGAPEIIKGVQIALSMVVILCLFDIGKRLSNRHAGLIAAWLYALSPTQIFFAQAIWAETIYGALLLFGVSLYLKLIESPKRFLYALQLGILLGLMALLKGVALWLIPIFIFCYLQLNSSKPFAFRQAFSILLGALILIAPYSIYASLKFQRLIVVDSTMGQMMWLGNNSFDPIGFDYGGPLNQADFDRHVGFTYASLESKRSDSILIQDVQPGDSLTLNVPRRSGGAGLPVTIQFTHDLSSITTEPNIVFIEAQDSVSDNADLLAQAINGISSSEKIVFDNMSFSLGLVAELAELDQGFSIDIRCESPGSHCNLAYLETESTNLSPITGRRYFSGGIGRNLYPPPLQSVEPFENSSAEWDALNEWAMQREDVAIREGVAWIRHNPDTFLARVPFRLSQMMTPHSFLTRHLRTGGWPEMPQWLKEWFVLQTVCWTFLVVLAGMTGLLTHLKSAYSRLSLGVIGFHFIAVACFAGLSRYRVPLEPLLMLGVGVLIVRNTSERFVKAASLLCLIFFLPLMLWHLPTGWDQWGRWVY